MSQAPSPEHLVIQTADGRMPVWRLQGDGDVGMIVLMDVYGIRPELHAMCEVFRRAGYTTWLPDLYYRHGERSFRTDAEPCAEAQRLNDVTHWRHSAADLGALLDACPMPRAVVAVGYCMGARHSLAAAVSHPQRIAACGLLHGGRLVSDDADSPHRLIERLAVPAYVGFARDDPTCPAAHQALLSERFAAATPAHQVERFDAAHGWMFPERNVHDPAAARRARCAMLDVFSTALKEWTA